MWYIGQDIVCIKTHSQGVVKEGQVYTIRGIKQGCCKVEIDVGVPVYGDKYSRCRSCGKVEKSNGVHWIYETLFKPLDEL